ncbi:MAG: hypothetical protein LBC11_03815 [Puniceicoccales bacterium]|jgi:hypothetical protein|nr:hypothetical protein [Puniceicoccales bacterium]
MDGVNQNQTIGWGAKLAESVIGRWNTISSVLGTYLTQAGYPISKDISGRNARTLGEVVKQASHFAILLVKFLAGKVVDFCKFTWSLAVAHPVITISLVLIFVIIPVLREYCAANEKFTLKAIPVIAWMIITQPFRLFYRILTVITGGSEVDKQKLTQKLTAAEEIIEQSQEVIEQSQETIRQSQEVIEQSQETIRQSQETIRQLKNLNPILRRELQGKQQAVTYEINCMENDEVRVVFNFAVNQIFNATDKIIRDGFFGAHSIRWNYLQTQLEEWRNDPQVQVVKTALDEWKKCLDLCIATL